MALRLRGLAATLLVACASAFAQSNPAARASRDISVLDGSWNGAHLEQRSNCTKPENNGGHGTYSQYTFTFNLPGQGLTLNEVAVQGLNCTWLGTYEQVDGPWVWSGNLTCSDGRTGTFQSESIFALTTLMSIRLAIRLNGAETCSIDAVISGARL